MSHARSAAAFLANRARARWHDGAVQFVRDKRDAAAAALPEWEELRERAAGIKRYALANLPDLLVEFERSALANGATVHWARDAGEANSIVLGLLEERGATRVVKSKSMLTEECGLNPYLEERGVEVIDTDLGERIVQLLKQPPSHIVMPAIHLRREDVGALFAEQLGTPLGETDPARLTEAARGHLRSKFLGAQAGITGVNFAVAENGAIVVCTNEGNADLGASLPPLHIACMGIEKVIPRLADLGVFLRLLARSATGQAITAYTSHFLRPRLGGALHVVIVDNGRSELLASESHRSALQCIRCGACLNTCPVYRRSGGHSYGVTVAGPIGSVLAPMRDLARHGDLPDACSLCGSCTEICPAKVDLHSQLLTWRSERVAAGHASALESFGAALLAEALSSPLGYAALGALLRFALARIPRPILRRLAAPWTKGRDLPRPPAKSFRAQWSERRGSA